MENLQSNLLERSIKSLVDSSNPSLSFSVFQWNVLARCYSNPKHYPNALPEQVTFEYRKEFIEKELKSLDADIICLQEVDERDLNFFSDICPTDKFKLSYVKKIYSQDGSLIIFKNKFDLIKELSLNLFEEDGILWQNQILNIVVLSLLHEDKQVILIICCVHLKAGPLERRARTLQSIQISNELTKLKQEYESKDSVVGIVISGDFNDVMDSSPLVNLLSNGFASAITEGFTCYHSFPLLFGVTYTYKGMLDYILYNDKLQVISKLEPPKKDKIKSGIPTATYPSDHISLFCTLKFLTSK